MKEISLLEKVSEFVKPYYARKDIMHDFTHLERIKLSAEKLIASEKLPIDTLVFEAALYMHGIIYEVEEKVRSFLLELGLGKKTTARIIQAAWESQKDKIPTTPEGKILHDAHLVEGGKYFPMVKALITGSLRGQTLQQTMRYVRNNLLAQGTCYTNSGQKLFEEVKSTSREIYDDLIVNTGMT